MKAQTSYGLICRIQPNLSFESSNMILGISMIGVKFQIERGTSLIQSERPSNTCCSLAPYLSPIDLLPSSFRGSSHHRPFPYPCYYHKLLPMSKTHACCCFPASGERTKLSCSLRRWSPTNNQRPESSPIMNRRMHTSLLIIPFTHKGIHLPSVLANIISSKSGSQPSKTTACSRNVTSLVFRT